MATHCSIFKSSLGVSKEHIYDITATHCNTLQQIGFVNDNSEGTYIFCHCKALHYTAIRCNTLQHSATYLFRYWEFRKNIYIMSLQHTATHIIALQQVYFVTWSAERMSQRSQRQVVSTHIYLWYQHICICGINTYVSVVSTHMCLNTYVTARGINTYVSLCELIHIYMHMYIDVYIHIDIFIHVCIYINIFTYIHI